MNPEKYTWSRISDQQQCVQFRKFQKMINHSTLLYSILYIERNKKSVTVLRCLHPPPPKKKSESPHPCIHACDLGEQPCPIFPKLLKCCRQFFYQGGEREDQSKNLKSDYKMEWKMSISSRSWFGEKEPILQDWFG